MNKIQDSNPNRLVFFDNLRALMVLLVLIFHSGASYGTMVAFWPFHEANPTEFVDLIMILFDVFMMAILFFIAGYFALPSLQKKGGKGFLVSKFKRLGIPWLVVILFVLPVLDYIHYYTQSVERGLPVRGFASHWLLSMEKIAEFRFGAMDMSRYLNMTQHFYQRYMWFLSLLFLFFLVFWMVFEVMRRWIRESEGSLRKESTLRRSVYITLAFIGFSPSCSLHR